MKQNSKLFETIKILIVYSIASFLYINSLNGEFVFDDFEAVVKNKDIQHTDILKIFENDFWGTKVTSKRSHKSYRPITILSYRLNHFMQQNLNPYGFHLFNVNLYSILSVLVYLIYKILLNKPKLVYLSTLLFIIHPIHVEVVSPIVGRADLLSACFYCIAFICNYKLIQPTKNIIKDIIYFCLICLFATLSTFSKEIGITILGVCFMYNYTISTKLSKRFIIIQLFFILFAASLFYLRMWIMNFETPQFQPMDNPAAFEQKLISRLLTYNYLYFLNILLLLWPNWLCFDWAMGCIKTIKDFNDQRVCVVILLWLIALFCLKRIVQKKCDKNVLISLFLTVIPFLPASNLIKIGFVIAERTLLLPSIGFSMLIASGYNVLLKLFPKNYLNIFLLVLIASHSLKTYIRVKDWLTQQRLYESGLDVCPDNAKIHYNIAKIHADLGNIPKAEEEYRKAIELYPSYDQALNNLANLLKDLKQHDEAEKLLRKAISISPEFASAWMNLGIVLSMKNKFREAEASYKRALSLRINYTDCYYNLGNLYLTENRNLEAIQVWKKAIELNQNHFVAWNNMLILYDLMEEYEEVLFWGDKALELFPNEPKIHLTLGNSFGKQNKFAEAEYHFLEAIRLDKTNALYISNLGVLYHRWGKKQKAKFYYKEALRLEPTLKNAKDNLAKL